MRSIQHSFDELVQKYPHNGNYTLFVRAIRNRNFSQSMIRRHLLTILHIPEDCEKSDIGEIMDNLMEVTKPRRKASRTT